MPLQLLLPTAKHYAHGAYATLRCSVPSRVAGRILTATWIFWSNWSQMRDLGVFEYVGIRQFIAKLFDESVDVVDRAALKPHVRTSAESDAIYAF